MSLEENKAVVRRFFAALDDQDLDAVASLLAPDYQLHFDGNPDMDRAAGIGFFGAFLAAFPDITHQIQDQNAKGDRVATRIIVRATQQKELMGNPATGNEMAISATNGRARRAEHDCRAMGQLRRDRHAGSARRNAATRAVIGAEERART